MSDRIYKKTAHSMAALDCINNHMHHAAEHMSVFNMRHWILCMTWPLFITCLALAKTGLVRAGPRGFVYGGGGGEGGTSNRRLEPIGARRGWGRV